MSPVRAEIVVDLGVLRANVRRLRDLVGPGVAMMTVVKADGYGHGMIPCAQAAREAGADWLGVATLDEALALRSAGDAGRILCWLSVPGEDYAAGIEQGVELTAYTVAELDEIVQAVGRAGRPASVQLKVDTGLSRGGSTEASWPALVEAARAAERAGQITVTGIWSHFACSDEPEHPENDRQERAYLDALALAEAAGLHPEVRHLANSAAAILRPSSRLDLVRCGIASYGVDPAPGLTDQVGLVPAMTVRARLAVSKQLRAGSGVSYGHTWVADRDTTVGLVPAGYGEGVPRACGQHRRGLDRRPSQTRARAHLHGSVRGRPRRRPPADGHRGGPVRPWTRRRTDGPGLGRGLRHHQLRDRDPDRRPPDSPLPRRRPDAEAHTAARGATR